MNLTANQMFSNLRLHVFAWLNLVLVAAWFGVVPNCAAQEPDLGPQFSEPQTVYYEFGLKITSKGKSTGILGTVPIPVDWPEQVVTVFEEKKTDNIRKLAYKDTAGRLRQLVIKANQLQAGEVAEGSVIFQVQKKNILPPANAQELLFAAKPSGKIKQYLKPSPYIESKHSRIKKLAKTIPVDDSESAWNQIEQIYTWVRENIEYEYDKQIHSCLEALDTGHGDCEELSSVFIAICRARGIPARAVWIPGHTYPEFYLVDEKGNGHWFPCQAAGSYQFGEMEEEKPILQKGDRFKLPGSKKYLRYIQPSLVAKDSASGLSIEFIARPIDPADIEGSSKKPR